MNPSWEQRLVKRYYDKLFKEYPLQTDIILSSLNCFRHILVYCLKLAEDTAQPTCHNTKVAR